MQEGIANNYRSSFNQFNQLQNNKEGENVIRKRNYNIDFLLIHFTYGIHYTVCMMMRLGFKKF